MFVAAVAGTSLLLDRVSPGVREAVVRACSTDEANLGRGRWWVLAPSAVVLDAPARAPALAGLLAVLAAGERRWGGRRLVLVMAAGHVGATVLVHAGVRAGVRRGRLGPGTGRQPDVGTSYAVSAVVAGLVAGLPPAVRRPAVLGLAAVVGRPLLAPQPRLADVGHGLAALIGLAVRPAARQAVSAGSRRA